MTVVPAAVAQGPEPSASELREAYPLHEGTPPEADSGATPTPAGAEDRPAPAVTRPSGGSSTVPIVIAAGLALLAFAAGFGLPLVRARSRPAASGPGDNGDAAAKPSQARRFEPSSRSGERSKPTAPRT
ncbi:MAG: hypothetical protein ACXW08_06085 [Solirubrobacteraceae bacterium]